jgi:hypothetical protein
MGRWVDLVATLDAIESPAVPLASKELDCEGNQGTGTVKAGAAVEAGDGRMLGLAGAQGHGRREEETQEYPSTAKETKRGGGEEVGESAGPRV